MTFIIKRELKGSYWWLHDMWTVSHHPAHGLLPASASPSSYKTVHNFEQFIYITNTTHNDLHVYVYRCTHSKQHRHCLTSQAALAHEKQQQQQQVIHILNSGTSSGGFTHFYLAAVSALLPHSHLQECQSSERRGQTERCPGVLEKSCSTKPFCHKPQHKPGVVDVREQTQKTHDSRGRCSGQSGC